MCLNRDDMGEHIYFINVIMISINYSLYWYFAMLVNKLLIAGNIVRVTLNVIFLLNVMQHQMYVVYESV